MKAVMILLGTGLTCALLAAGTVAASAARERTICNARLGCTTGVISRKPIGGKQCRMLNFASSKYRGFYLCS